MSLTVPKSGAAPGRAAVVQVDTPQTGAAIADLGAVIQAKGQQMRAASREIDLRRTQLDMARDLDQARLTLEQSTDPDQIDRDWPAAAAAVRQKYLDPGPDGKPRFDPQTAQALDLGLTELTDRHASALGRRAIDMRQSQQEGAWVALSADLVKAAVDAPPDTLPAYIETGEAAINDRLARGTITPEQAARDRLALRQSIAEARADVALEADPAAFLAAAEAGTFTDLPADALVARRNAATRSLKQAEAAAAKASEVAQKDRQAAIGKRLGDMSGLMLKGFKVEDETFLTDPEVQAHPGYAEARAAQALRDEIPGIRQMTPAELDAQIDAEMAKPVTAEFQTERVKVLRQWRDEVATRADTDFIGLARDTDLPVPDLPAFDPADPAPFADGLSQRLALDAWATERGHTRTQAIFAPEERAQLKTVLDPKADAAPKVALAQTLLTAAQGDLSRLAPVLELDPVFSRTLRIMAENRDPALAAEILRGQQKAELGTVNLPSAKQMTSVFDTVTGGTFADDPRRANEVMQTARALYADSATGVNPDGEDSVIPFLDDTEAQDRFATAVQRALGARPDRDGALTVGGLQTINDAPVHLPPGIAAADVEDALDALSMRAQGYIRNTVKTGTVLDETRWTRPQMVKTLTGEAPASIPTLEDALTAAAARPGDLPELGSSPEDRLDTLTLRRVGETDLYEFTYEHNGQMHTVPVRDDPYGRAFRFRLADLIRETRK